MNLEDTLAQRLSDALNERDDLEAMLADAEDELDDVRRALADATRERDEAHAERERDCALLNRDLHAAEQDAARLAQHVACLPRCGVFCECGAQRALRAHEERVGGAR